jgi:glycosyltransferase involved in cell wall biosynthesis
MMVEEGNIGSFFFLRLGGEVVVNQGNKKTLSIALLGTRGIPARYGGFETFVEQLSTRLVARGHSVVVYGRCSFSEKWGAREAVDGVARRVTPTFFHKYLETPVHAFTSFLDLIFKKYDVALLCNAANAPFAFLLKFRGKPLLINVDGIERNRGKWNALGKAWYLLGERCAMWWATQVVSDADVIAEYYEKTYQCNSVVIPYGVHPVHRPAGVTLAEFSLREKGFLLYVSRLEPENNALGVIQAYRNVKTDLPLVIVGDAPYATEYKETLRAAADSRVIFTGFQFGEAYQELQSNCFLYVQATEVGGTHPALVESMSYGNCVIANGTPENIEVVGNAAKVYPKNDFSALTKLMQQMIDEPSEAKRIGKLAKERALSKYSWDSVVDLYENLFQKLTKN